MTQTQKKIFEWPFIILIIWLSQAVELSVLSKMPSWIGAAQLVPIFIFYLASTRSWGPLVLLTLGLSALGASTVSYPTSVYMSVHLWTALVLRASVSSFSLEGRRSFLGLALSGQAFAKVLTWVLLHTFYRTLPPLQSISIVIFNSAFTACVAWLVYPYLRSWDRYFEHNPEDSGDLNTSLVK